MVLDLFAAEQDNFIAHYVTIYEILFHNCDSQTKQQSIERSYNGSSSLKKFRAQKLTGKILTSVSRTRTEYSS